MTEDIGLLLKMNARLQKATTRHMDAALLPLGLRAGTYPFLLTLGQAGAVTLEELAEALRLDKALASRVCARLIAQGFVTKTADENDARARRIALTEKGRALLPDVRRTLDDWIAAITQDLTGPEQAALMRALSAVVGRAEQRGTGNK